MADVGTSEIFANENHCNLGL